jgi:2-polyprenyl-6-methoxyphenol hydroxylase-like FAD-dependent oxidoreductase
MRAVVCGAGIAGLALARCLSGHGWGVVVLERAPGPREQGYMIDFFGPGFDAAEAMGVLPRLRELGYRVEGAGYYDAAGRLRAEVSYRQLADAIGGDRLLSLLRPDLERVLRESLTCGVDLRFGACVVAVDDTGGQAVVATSGGQVFGADLVVGADGVHSTVRRLVFGPEQEFLRYLGYHTAAYVFDDPQVCDQVRGRFCLTDSVAAQLGFYGLRDGRVATFAVHRTPDPALPPDHQDAVRRAYAGLGWVAPRALAACPPHGEVYYDQVTQIQMPTWSRGRVTLVGDACYAVSLLAGQGASLGIAGAYVLAEQLARADTVDDALARYEQMWRPVATARQREARRTARWFVPRTATGVRVRRAALQMSHLPGLDHQIARLLTGKPTTIVQQLAHRP